MIFVCRLQPVRENNEKTTTTMKTACLAGLYDLYIRWKEKLTEIVKNNNNNNGIISIFSRYFIRNCVQNYLYILCISNIPGIVESKSTADFKMYWMMISLWYILQQIWYISNTVLIKCICHR